MCACFVYFCLFINVCCLSFSLFTCLKFSIYFLPFLSISLFLFFLFGLFLFISRFLCLPVFYSLFYSVSLCVCLLFYRETAQTFFFCVSIDCISFLGAFPLLSIESAFLSICWLDLGAWLILRWHSAVLQTIRSSNFHVLLALSLSSNLHTEVFLNSNLHSGSFLLHAFLPSNLSSFDYFFNIFFLQIFTLGSSLIQTFLSSNLLLRSFLQIFPPSNISSFRPSRRSLPSSTPFWRLRSALFLSLHVALSKTHSCFTNCYFLSHSLRHFAIRCHLVVTRYQAFHQITFFPTHFPV